MFKRLQMQFPSSPAVPNSTPSIAELTAERAAGPNLLPSVAQQYSFFLPQHYEPNYAYPLLVWLHGRQGNERQLHRVLPLLSMRNYTAVGVRGNAKVDNGWDWQVDAAGAYQSVEQNILHAIDSAQDRMHVHRQRIFVGGFQSGGALAVKLALRRPDLFAGAISLGGCLPTGSHLFGNLHQSRKFPLLICQSQQAADTSMDTLCDRLKLFHSANLNVMLRLYPGADELTTNMLSDMNEWMMERVTGIPSLDLEQEDHSSSSSFPNVNWN